MTYRRPLLNWDDLEIGDAIFYYAWSCGLDHHRAFDLSAAAEFVTDFGNADPSEVRAVVHERLRLGNGKRTASQTRRYVIRNRRKFFHDQSLVRRHENGVIKNREGVRCGGCSHIPPQPGEIMEPDWRKCAGLPEGEESNA